ncbi:hypothetical protein ACE1CI_34800 [Aerosakkonemataceae cyanobacterium BLCC-F50]|uniref:Uncharacterized protein n=1 Tax=Floridaenema flaviceps BLCC-F50 TaxID=3153642 RepID=A0ABV4Y4S6_9CYAN
MSLAVLDAGSLAVLAQSQHRGVSNNSNDDISSILNLVRGYGAIGEIVIIDNYASLNYFFGQNGDTVTLARQNGRWRIVAGRQTTSCARGSCQTDSCRADVNCLVRKGVPRNIAIQLISRLENSRARQERNVQSFRQAWARSNRNIAPFLGYWQNQNWPQTSQEIAISIWPSYRENKVCIIGISENSQYVIEGTVDGNTIRTQNGNFTLNRPVDFTEYIDSTKHFLIGAQPLNTWYLNSANNQKLENAGCTASLPRDSGQQTATGRVSTPSQSSPVTASSQELVFSNMGCTSNLRNILGQSAPDYCHSAEADSGILFDKFQQTKNPDGSITVDITLFNRGSADGLIEIYDANGNFVDGQIINGNKPPTGFLQSGYRMFVEYPQTWWSKYPQGDYRRDLKEQEFKNINIPAGGFVNITKSSNLALWYNTAMLVIEVSQLKDPEFTQQKSVKKFILGFAKEAVFSKNSETVINIFKSEPSLKGVFTLDFLDERKVGEVLQNLWEYTKTISFNESDGFWKEPKNPLYEAFKDVGLDTGNVGVENAIDRFLLPGLGTFVRSVRQGGNALNTLARLMDYNNAKKSGDKGTITIRNVSTTSRR